jgi:hypothetical protein
VSDERTYTVDEANAMLPELRERLARIREARQVLLRTAEKIRGSVTADGGGVAGEPEYFDAKRLLADEIERFAEQNILLRDPETGLLDFPGELDGRSVYLCWRADEDRVAHWHELTSGFAGRRPL